MRERLLDDDGDVWVHEGDDRWHMSGEPTLTRAELAERYGPVTPCDPDGEPLRPEPDVRALVAAAFEDMAGRMAPLIRAAEFGVAQQVYTAFANAAEETAAAIRSGEISSSATNP